MYLCTLQANLKEQINAICQAAKGWWKFYVVDGVEAYGLLLDTIERFKAEFWQLQGKDLSFFTTDHAVAFARKHVRWRFIDSKRQNSLQQGKLTLLEAETQHEERSAFSPYSSHSHTPQNILLWKEGIEELVTLLGKKNFTILMLSADYNSTEIAEKVGLLSAMAVRTRLHRIREQLENSGISGDKFS